MELVHLVSITSVIAVMVKVILVEANMVLHVLYICLMSEAAPGVTLKVLTAQGEIQGGGPENHAVLLVDGHLPVSAQVVETALKQDKAVSPTRGARTREERAREGVWVFRTL